MKKPSEGDRIIHSECQRSGTVDLVLSAQFVYISDDGNRHYCMFKEDWKYEKTPKLSK